MMIIKDIPITIRKADDSDVDPLYTLIRQAMAVYAKQSGITQPLDALTESKSDLLHHIHVDHVLVAELHDQLAGTVRLIRADSETAYFSRFAVLPHLQQTGVGRQLYQAAEEWLRGQGFRQILLHTALSNEPLVGFYQARGFRLLHSSQARGYARGTFIKVLYSHQNVNEPQ